MVAIAPGWRSSRTKRHIVKHIIAPAGVPIEDRPPVPTEDERIEAYETKKAAKDARRAAKAEAERAAREAEKAAKRAAEADAKAEV